MLIPHKGKNKGKYISFHYLRGWKARKIRKVQEISPEIPICNYKIFFDPLLTQNGIGTGSSGRKQRKIHPPNSVKQRKTEPKWLRFFFGTTYGPEGRGFESLTACQKTRNRKASGLFVCISCCFLPLLFSDPNADPNGSG